MLKIQRRKTLITILLGCFVISMAFIGFNHLPELHMRASLAITRVRGTFFPTGELPTAEAADASSTAQQVFWLPDLITMDVDPHGSSAAVQTGKATKALPSSVILPPPVFDPHKDYQDWNNCGPATLGLGLRYWGWTGDQFTISDVIRPKRQDKNVNMDELAWYVNQMTDDYQAEVRVGGDLAILKTLISEGFPVIIEESFKLEKSAWLGDDRWAGHYLLLTGYDEDTRQFTAQDSYFGPDRQLSFTEIDQAWQAFNHVYLVTFADDDLQKVQALLGEHWQTTANLDLTVDSLKKELQSDPGNAFAWFNLGSSLVAQQQYEMADQAFDKAREIGLPQRMLRYQFGPLIAAYQTGDIKDLLQLLDYALTITPDSEEALLWKGWSYASIGDDLSAVSLFNRALDANPGYRDAIYAIEKVRP